MDLNLAIVLCRMLGEHTAKSYYDMEVLNNEEGAVLNVTYVCQGNEDSVAECEEQSKATVNCSRDQRIAGITCASRKLKISLFPSTFPHHTLISKDSRIKIPPEYTPGSRSYQEFRLVQSNRNSFNRSHVCSPPVSYLTTVAIDINSL